MTHKVHTSLDSESIKALVDRFYRAVQQDPELSPVFEAAIGTTAEEWKHHLEKMYAFWNTIMLASGEYVGNPLQTHRKLPPFPPHFFDRWLQLFAVSADQVLAPEIAQLFKYKSQRMAAFLSRGIYAA